GNAGIDLLFNPPSGPGLALVPTWMLWNKGPLSDASLQTPSERPVTFYNPAFVSGTPGTPGVGLIPYGVTLANGPSLHTASAKQLSRGAVHPLTLTLNGIELTGATSVTFTPSTGISAGAPLVSKGGQTVTVSVTLTGATPLGLVYVAVVTPSG